MGEYAEWCERCDCWPDQICRCELHPIKVYPERHSDGPDDADMQTGASEP